MSTEVARGLHSLTSPTSGCNYENASEQNESMILLNPWKLSLDLVLLRVLRDSLVHIGV